MEPITSNNIHGGASFVVIAKARAYSDNGGNLVAEGDEKAAVLVAREGQELPHSRIRQYANYRDWFTPVNPKDEFPPPDDRAEKDEQGAGSPKGKGGRRTVVPPAAE